MKEDLLKIIKHFGLYNQLKKLNEESYEVIEAVRNFEEDYTSPDKSYIEEEIADLLVVLKQIQFYYKIDREILRKRMKEKTKRTLERIESGYYD